MTGKNLKMICQIVLCFRIDWYDLTKLIQMSMDSSICD